MITQEEAFRLAKRLKPDFDGYDEYDDAYVFTCTADDGNIGGEGPLAILKADGRHIYSFAGYLLTCSAKFVRKLL